jgi:ectoine hydroxylase-related dioxygenase (phytanoyl-CoA dioxygenase family)
MAASTSSPIEHRTGPADPAVISALRDAVCRDGIAGIPGALPRSWGERLLSDFETLFAEARSRPDGTVNRGTNRYYFTVHPERLHGFLDLVTHPVVTALSAEVLGPDWLVVEVAFDVPLPGSKYQPWHRDFPSPRETRDEHRLTSLAFNLTAVDVTPEMGPFEIAPGTQWDDGSAFDHGMFPTAAATSRYDELRQPRMPRLGDMSVRSGLTIHRGTPNRSTVARPVLILGVVGPEADPGPHGLQLSTSYAESLPGDMLRRLRATVVPELQPLVQAHTIEGLVMGD